PRSDRTTRPRRTSCCGPERFRLSTPNRQVAGSSPARSASCSGSSVGRAVPGCTTTTAAVASSTTAGRSEPVLEDLVLRRSRARQAARTAHDRGSTARSRRDAMSYLLQYARPPDSITPRTRVAHVDEYKRLNRPGLYGDAYVRVFVEDTTARRRRRGADPQLV